MGSDPRIEQPPAPAEADYQGVDNLEVMAEARNYNRFLINLILGNAPHQARTVDFGAGCGTFARQISDAGFDVCCVEPDSHLRQVLVDKGLSVEPSIEAIRSESVGYLYTLNVLEHIEDDQAALSELCRVLAPGGKILIYVPAFESLFSSMDRKVGHFRRYQRRDLEDKVRAAGLTVTESRYADSLGYFATRVFKLFDRGSGAVNLTALIAYDRLIFPLSLLLDRLLSRFIGKNVVIVAQRPIPDSSSTQPGENS